MEDLLDLVYWLTCLKTAPQLQQDVTWPESDRRQGAEIVKSLTLPALMRVWQVLHKGYEEVSRSPLPSQAAEMVLVRVGYLSDLPQADDLLAALQGAPASSRSLPAASQNSPAISPAKGEAFNTNVPLTSPFVEEVASERREETADEEVKKTQSESAPIPVTFPALLEMLKEAKEPILYSHILQDIHLVSYVPGEMTIRLADMAAKTLPTQLRQVLEKMTGQSWIINIAIEGGEPTQAQQKKLEHDEKVKISQEHPLVKSLTERFPGATVTAK